MEKMSLENRKKIINNVLTKNNKLVVSTGGGIFSNNEIRDIIIKNLKLFSKLIPRNSGRKVEKKFY